MIAKITSKNNRAHNFIVLIFFIAHVTGTMTHIALVNDVFQSGFFNYSQSHSISPFISAYWLSLTIINPSIAILLLVKRKTGILLGFFNILINVTINSSVQILSLNNITFLSVYDALGNVFNSLQIAFLIFSLITLPLILFKNDSDSAFFSVYFNFFSSIPFLALFTGLIIHIFGIFRLFTSDATLWNIWVHTSMILLDSFLILTLYNRIKLGYYCSIILFFLFGLLQSGFALCNYLGLDSPFNLQMAITISVCCLAVTSLLKTEYI